MQYEMKISLNKIPFLGLEVLKREGLNMVVIKLQSWVLNIHLAAIESLYN